MATLSEPVRIPPDPSPLVLTMQRELTEACMTAYDSHADEDKEFFEALSYSMGLRGKRVRGVMLLLVTAGLGQDWRKAMDCAVAVEMVHTASLIIDDLPSMDDADTRRGQPTSHRKFSESTAILAAISLLCDASARVARSEPLGPQARADAAGLLSATVGSVGMSLGQFRDLTHEAKGAGGIERTHGLKTALLFATAAELGCIAAGAGEDTRRSLEAFGMQMGQAFQELDDLLDVLSSDAVLGKDTAQDDGKPTFVNLLGPKAAEEQALGRVSDALEILKAAPISGDALGEFSIDLVRMMLSQYTGAAAAVPS